MRFSRYQAPAWERNNQRNSSFEKIPIIHIVMDIYFSKHEFSQTDGFPGRSLGTRVEKNPPTQYRWFTSK